MKLDETHLNHSVDVRVGELVEISLPGNLTTGYSWVLRPVDPALLGSVGEIKYRSQGKGLGAGGRFTLRLKAKTPGETRVELVYRRPFDPQGTPPASEFRVFIKVTPERSAGGKTAAADRITRITALL